VTVLSPQFSAKLQSIKYGFAEQRDQNQAY
jgi:hypothetical protein